MLVSVLLLVLSSIADSSAVSQGLNGRAVDCRCFPGDSCWPSKVDWDAFNTTVKGRLVKTVPLAAPCHGEAYNQPQCQNIRNAWTTPDTHIETSSSIMAPFFANNSCNPFLEPEAQCVVGAYVQYAVAAKDAADYKATIQFAKMKNIRLVIRNTAHDWLGKSTGAGALAIWTHQIKGVQIVDYSSPHYTGKAVKLSAGTQLREAYQAAHDASLVVVGGTCPSIGLAGGYTQGGGHGLSVSKLGLGADQALEWEVVTTEGELLKASPTENEDLYWALSGGGGGTYGVVLSLTVRAYADGLTAAANLTFSNAGISQETFYAGIRDYVEELPPVLDAGATSTWLNSKNTFILSPAVGFGMTKQRIDELHKPVLDRLDALNISYTYYSNEFPTYLDMFRAMNPFTETATFQIGSRLIPRNVISSSSAEFVNALQSIGETGAWISGVSFNVSMVPNVANSVNPAWRSTSVSLVVGTFYSYTDPAANLANQHLMTNTIVPKLASLIPGGGSAYGNEGDPWEPNWRQVFWGSNYDRLKSIKEKYDPQDVLYARTAVGSEAWVEQADGRLCRAG